MSTPKRWKSNPTHIQIRTFPRVNHFWFIQKSWLEKVNQFWFTRRKNPQFSVYAPYNPDVCNWGGNQVSKGDNCLCLKIQSTLCFTLHHFYKAHISLCAMLWGAIVHVSTPFIRSNSMEFVPSVMRLRLALGKYRLCHSVAKRVYPKQWLSWRTYKFIHPRVWITDDSRLSKKSKFQT